MRPGFWQIILVIVLIFILFGSSKIPDMMRNLAGGINVFKKELKDDKKEKGADTPKKAAARPAPAKKTVARKAPAKKAAAKKPAVKKTTKK